MEHTQQSKCTYIYLVKDWVRCPKLYFWSSEKWVFIRTSCSLIIKYICVSKEIIYKSQIYLLPKEYFGLGLIGWDPRAKYGGVLQAV